MARFRHPLKLKHIGKDELILLINEFNSQKKIAQHLGVSQMTISRRMDFLGIQHDGKVNANKNKQKCEKQSKAMIQKYQNKEIVPFWQNKRMPKEVVEKRILKLKGKPTWNSGTKKSFIKTCVVCDV
jgi:DNA-binding transcriptional MocR family regulator